MTTRKTLSSDSIAKATESLDEFSGHGDAMGAAGVKDDIIATGSENVLDKSGEAELISPPEGGFQTIYVGLSWNNIITEQATGMMGLVKKVTRQGVDLDLGCFFELKDGTRGILQPFGELFGRFDAMPYMALAGDERTGDSKGDDEYLRINGQYWSEIERILIYAYIYEGGTDWSQIMPVITLNVGNGQPPVKLEPQLQTNNMTVCAVASLKNVKDGIQIVTHGEYFASQPAMDQAFGFGLKWEDGHKE